MPGEIPGQKLEIVDTYSSKQMSSSSVIYGALREVGYPFEINPVPGDSDSTQIEAFPEVRSVLTRLKLEILMGRYKPTVDLILEPADGLMEEVGNVMSNPGAVPISDTDLEGLFMLAYQNFHQRRGETAGAILLHDRKDRRKQSRNTYRRLKRRGIAPMTEEGLRGLLKGVLKPILRDHPELSFPTVRDPREW